MSDVSSEVSSGSEEEVKSKSKKSLSKKRPEPSDSDSGDESPPPKKSSKKSEKSDSKKKSSSGKKEKDTEKSSWDLSNTRSVAINEYRGQFMVDIREYYMDKEGERRPGKKGISLSTAQWAKFVDSVKEIDAAMKKASGS